MFYCVLCSKAAFRSYDADIVTTFECIIRYTGYFLKLLPVEKFEELHKAGRQDMCLDMPQEEARLVTDKDALRIMRKITHRDSCPEFQTLKQGKRVTPIGKMKREGRPLHRIFRLPSKTMYRIHKYLSN